VQTEALEVTKAAAGGEPDADGQADHDEDQHHAGKSPTQRSSRPIVPRAPGGVQPTDPATLSS
jgi:hypothetical protein